ncbi:MAG: hypothetical protein ACRDFX_13515, partial [Chloroflexota bacterium]
GQTGVAPNAIELHPVLGLRFLGGPVRVPPPPPLPVPRVSGPFSIHVSAYPQTVRKGDRETISARTRSGVVCNLRVTYPDGYVSRARSITESKTAINGLVSWSWSVGSTVLGQSQAQVTCRSGTRTATAGTGFRIV